MKYAVILGNVGSCSDRYMTGGYSEPFTVEQLFERLSTIDNVHAVEFVGGWQLTLDNRQMVKEQLEKYKLTPVSIIPDHFGRPIWGLGAFTHPDPDVRQAAVKETMDMVVAARFIGCDTISIWNGQDGYDYPSRPITPTPPSGWWKGCGNARWRLPTSASAWNTSPRNPATTALFPMCGRPSPTPGNARCPTWA